MIRCQWRSADVRPDLDNTLTRNSTAFRHGEGSARVHVSDLPCASSDDGLGRIDGLGDVLLRRRWPIVVRILSSIAHLPHPLELTQGVVPHERGPGHPGVPVRATNRSNAQSFRRENRGERFASSVIRRGERHRLVVCIGQRVRRTNMASSHLDDSRCMIEIRRDTLQSTVNEHVFDPLGQLSHASHPS